MDSIVVNTVVVVKRMVTTRAEVVSHTNCRDLYPSVARCGPWDVFSVTATAQICKVSCDEESSVVLCLVGSSEQVFEVLRTCYDPCSEPPRSKDSGVLVPRPTLLAPLKERQTLVGDFQDF